MIYLYTHKSQNILRTEGCLYQTSYIHKQLKKNEAVKVGQNGWVHSHH